MSDQFRKRRDIERRRQKTLKPDYLEEIRLGNPKRRRVVFGRFEIDSEFRAKHPAEFTAASRNRDRVFSYIKDPIVFLREREGEPVFVFCLSLAFEDFVEIYGLEGREKSFRQIFQRLRGYAEAIKVLLNEELRQWPMRAFVNPPLPREFHFSNRLGMVASVWVLAIES
jgi:hypothetical protein